MSIYLYCITKYNGLFQLGNIKRGEIFERIFFISDKKIISHKSRSQKQLNKNHTI